MGHTQDLDKQKFDELIAGFIGNTLTETERLEGKTLTNQSTFCQIRHIFPIKFLCYTVQYN